MKTTQKEHSVPKPQNTGKIYFDKSLIKDEEWLSMQDMMRYFKISRSTLKRLVQGNKIPSIKLGNSLVFPKNLTNKILQDQALKHLDISNSNGMSLDN